jgi:CheY-like chemotaxis protein
LGLATVYGIVRQHEGWVEVASVPGKGTTFAVFFPARTDTSPVVRAADPLVPPVRGGNETILVVEDEATVRAMGRIVLQDCGYQVLEAESGLEAIDLWQRHPETIQLLLTDMVMPEGLSGVELAQQLRRQRPELKVLFTSGYSVDEFDTDFFKGEGNNFLQKPYTRSTLAKAVREVLDSNS